MRSLEAGFFERCCQEAWIAKLGEPHHRLPYLGNGKRPYDDRVEREPVARNLPGARSRYRSYLVCPPTGRRATGRYLRSGAGSFAHREAVARQQCLSYDSQLAPNRFRGLASYFAVNVVDREWEQPYCKDRNTFYRGNPPTWYARLLALANRGAAGAPGLLKLLTGC